jgi:hypothetical protein
MLLSHPELRSCLGSNASDDNLSEDQKLFLQFLILHLNSSFRALHEGALINSEGLDEDVRHFFNKPGPRIAWEGNKQFYDKDFVSFVEDTAALSSTGDTRRGGG